MTIRARIVISWTFTTDMVPGTWHQVEDFKAYVDQHLNAVFQGYKSETTFTVVEKVGRTYSAVIVWDVNLDGVMGAWHEASDHLAYALMILGKGRMTYTNSVEAKAYYQAGFSEVVDAAFALRDTTMTPIRLVNTTWLWNGIEQGEAPEALFLEWTNTTREEQYAAFKREMDAIFPA